MKNHFSTAMMLLFSIGFSLSMSTAVHACNLCGPLALASPADTLVHYPQEKHLKNLRQLTRFGDYAEAYFSFDNSMVTFQAKSEGWGAACDQIYVFPFNDGDMLDHTPKLISNGVGRTTCSFFMLQPVQEVPNVLLNLSGGWMENISGPFTAILIFMLQI